MQGFINTYAGSIFFTFSAVIIIIAISLPLMINSTMLSSKKITPRQKLVVYIKFFQFFLGIPFPLIMFWLYFTDPTLEKSLFKVFIIMIASFVFIDSFIYLLFNNELKGLVVMMRNKGGIWKWVFSTIPQKESYIQRGIIGIIGIIASIVFVFFALSMNFQ